MNINMLNCGLSNNKRETINMYIKDVFKSLCSIDELPSDVEKEFNKLIDFIYFVIMDICHNEGVDATDIKVIGDGVFSVVLGIGNKVLKIGEQRGTALFPNNPYIVMPLLRRNIKIGEFDFFIEVTEKVNTNTDIKATDFYHFYKKFRDNTKLKWTDIKEKNIGILLKDNKIYWNEPLYNDDKNLGLQSYQETDTLKAGDLVILDADYIFDENISDNDIFFPYDTYYEQFELKYQFDSKKNVKKRKQN